MRIEVLGTGCAKCAKLEENARAAAGAVDVPCEIVKITELSEIASRGVMVTPALVVEGAVVASGRVPEPQEIADWIERRAVR